MKQASFHVDQTFQALADPTRRQVVELLRSGPRKASDLAEKMSVSRPLMSRHLRILRTGGLIEEERVEHDARLRLFKLCPEPFDHLTDWLEHIQGFWTDQLAAFKAHVERDSKGELS